MITEDSTACCPGLEIVEDLRSAIAGAACLLVPGVPAEDLVCARNLLLQARERGVTLGEIVRG